MEALSWHAQSANLHSIAIVQRHRLVTERVPLEEILLRRMVEFHHGAEVSGLTLFLSRGSSSSAFVDTPVDIAVDAWPLVGDFLVRYGCIVNVLTSHRIAALCSSRAGTCRRPCVRLIRRDELPILVPERACIPQLKRGAVTWGHVRLELRRDVPW